MESFPAASADSGATQPPAIDLNGSRDVILTKTSATYRLKFTDCVRRQPYKRSLPGRGLVAIDRAYKGPWTRWVVESCARPLAFLLLIVLSGQLRQRAVLLQVLVKHDGLRLWLQQDGVHGRGRHPPCHLLRHFNQLL